MRTIHKYSMNVVGFAPRELSKTFDMPEGAQILHCNRQGDSICFWALVNTENRNVKRSFRVYGTGHIVEEGVQGSRYVGTCHFESFQLVLHLFEVAYEPA